MIKRNTNFFSLLFFLFILLSPNNAIAKKDEEAKKNKSALNFQVNIGRLAALDNLIVYYFSTGIRVAPKLYVGPYLELFQDDFSLTRHKYNERVEGTNFGASILYEEKNWFFLGTLAPLWK